MQGLQMYNFGNIPFISQTQRYELNCALNVDVLDLFPLGLESS